MAGCAGEGAGVRCERYLKMTAPRLALAGPPTVDGLRSLQACFDSPNLLLRATASRAIGEGVGAAHTPCRRRTGGGAGRGAGGGTGGGAGGGGCGGDGGEGVSGGAAPGAAPPPAYFSPPHHAGGSPDLERYLQRPPLEWAPAAGAGRLAPAAAHRPAAGGPAHQGGEGAFGAAARADWLGMLPPPSPAAAASASLAAGWVARGPGQFQPTEAVHAQPLPLPAWLAGGSPPRATGTGDARGPWASAGLAYRQPGRGRPAAAPMAGHSDDFWALPTASERLGHRVAGDLPQPSSPTAPCPAHRRRPASCYRRGCRVGSRGGGTPPFVARSCRRPAGPDPPRAGAQGGGRRRRWRQGQYRRPRAPWGVVRQTVVRWWRRRRRRRRRRTCCGGRGGGSCRGRGAGARGRSKR